MRSRVILFSLIAIVSLGLVATPHGLTSVALAQDATPAADFVTPDPAECQVAPRTIDSVITVYATPATGASVISQPTEGTPAKEAADAATVAAVTATVHEVAASINAGDFLRVLALYTDNGAQALLGGEPLTADEVVAFYGGTPVPAPDDARESLRVRDVRAVADGRATALVDLREPAGEYTVFLTLVRQGDRSLVDSQVETPSAPATPAP